MGEAVTDALELLVGLGCVAAAVPALRSPRLRVFGALLLVAGAAAVVHALVRLFR